MSDDTAEWDNYDEPMQNLTDGRFGSANWRFTCDTGVAYADIEKRPTAFAIRAWKSEPQEKGILKLGLAALRVQAEWKRIVAVTPDTNKTKAIWNRMLERGLIDEIEE